MSDLKKRRVVKPNTKSPKTSSPTPPLVVPPTQFGKTLKFLVFIVVLFFFLFVVHHTLQFIETPTPLGKLYTVGFFGQDLHLYCLLTENYQDVVVFHHGILGSSVDWYIVQHDLKKNGISSCSYDRPGYGFSPLPEANPPDMLENSKNLNELLKQHLKGKTFKTQHVGIDYGAALALVYANTHPDEVTGVVLVDPIHPYYDQIDLKIVLEEFLSQVQYLNILTKTGIIRLLSWLGYFKLSHVPPFPYSDLIRIFSTQDKYLTAVMREITTLNESIKFLTKYQKPTRQIPLACLLSTVESAQVSGISLLRQDSTIISSLQMNKYLHLLEKNYGHILNIPIEVNHMAIPFSTNMTNAIKEARDQFSK